MQIEQESDDHKAKRMAIIEAFSGVIKEKRRDAIVGRAASGIEQTWTEDEDHYNGEDDATRGTVTKGRNATDGLSESKRKQQTRSTVFLKITRPYCDAAAARVADMLLPTDDRNWALRPTPLPQMIEATKDTRPVDEVVKPKGVMGAIKGMFAPQQPQQQPVPTVAEVAKQAMDKAQAASDAAQDQIDDWLTECRYHAEVRKVIESCTRIGTGILKGPMPSRKTKRAVTKTEAGWQVDAVSEISPESTEVSAWNFYPDPACGNDIHKGNFVFEVEDITARMLIGLKGQGYIDDMIDMCVEEGPTSAIDGTKKNAPDQKTADKDLFQIWYFHGHVSKQNMEAAGCKCGDKDFYPCIVTMVNDRVIKVSLSQLNTGEFPYDVMVWQSRTDHWAGVGVSRQMRECQKGANAGIRNIMDNAGLASGPQIIVDRTKIVPANGRWEIVPRKVWYTKDGADAVDVTKAFMFVTVPMLQEQLMPLLQFWLKEAEDVTGLPMLLQGQQGAAPETVGGMTMLNNNANSVLRRIARTFDDRITEPHIGRYYEYLLLHCKNDAAKGDFTIDARGSSALIERDMQNQQLMQMVGMSLNPAYGIDPELVMMEVLKGMRFDTKRLVISDEKKQQMAQQPPPKAPQIEAAEIREKGAMEREKMRLEAAASQGDANRSLTQMMKEIEIQLAREDLSAEERRDLMNHKVDLAKLTMELKQQAALSPGPQVRQPPTEPFGRAENGHAYPQ